VLRDWETCWEWTERDGGVRDGTGGFLLGIVVSSIDFQKLLEHLLL